MTCLVTGCGSPHSAKGYCGRHYMRLRRTGDPLGCNYGHELTPENTQYDRRRNCRRCRTCARVWDRRAKAKQRAKAAAA